jgi:hypothetical protein
MSLSYFPTVPLTDAQLYACVQAADTQTDIALQVFRHAYGRKLSAYQVWVIGREMGCPWAEWSARRSVTVLTYRKLVRKTKEIVDGPRGHRNYLYELIEGTK